MPKKSTLKKEKEDIVSIAKDKKELAEMFFKTFEAVKDNLTYEEVTLYKKSFEVFMLDAEQKKKEEDLAKKAEKERKIREAQQRKKEREERAKQLRAEEEHKRHVESVTCMDLPLDFENAYANDENIDVCVESVSDGLMHSLDKLGRVDIEYISEISGKTLKEVIEALKDSIFQNPLTWNECFYKGWETSDEYLSGNILYKLDIARDANEDYYGYFSANVEALESLVSADIDIKDIYITLGSPWVPSDIIDDFILHIAGIAPSDHEAEVFAETKYKVVHDEYTGIWEIPEKGRFESVSNGKFKQISKSVFGTERMPMLVLLEHTLNQKSIQVTDGVDSGKLSAVGTKIINRYTNNDETIKAIEKQEKLVEEFTKWVWDDTDRSKRLQSAYCNKFGNIRKRIFSGEFLEFPNMNSDIKLYDYQKNAVARILFTPNTLLAHDVGAGKTYIMIAAGMELRRLGKSKKNLYVVPNNILGQWKNTFLRMYPSAKLLVVDEKNFKPSKRAETIEKIKTEDFDAILMAYSSFDLLSLSRKYYMELYKHQLEMLEKAKSKFASSAKIEAKKRKIEKTLEKLSEEIPKNICVLPFDELGINTMFLDEAHYYKNVPIETAIHRVHGINKEGSDKCKGMMDKVHCIQRQNNGGRVIFATGTPITNSLTDIFILQKYLQEGELEFSGIHNFDNWVGMFAEKTTEYEIDVDTNSYHMKTRFARFKNIPELTAILSSIADFHHEDKPDCLPLFEGYTDSVAHGSDTFRDYLREISTRADDVRNKRVDRKLDNMLKITSDGRKAALDIRLIDRIYGRESNSKVMRCAENIADIYYDSRDFKGTQLVFCDISTPKDGFNLYDELKGLLVVMGIPSDEIAFIHDAQNDAEKEKLFRELRNGTKAVIIGSTFKTGHGVNIQERLVALHHLDVPWRPADMIQREGRILRRGNTSEKIKIFRYITKGSFDAYSWQLLEAKQRFISQILSGDCTERECADVDEAVLNYAEVKALAVGNPKIKRRVEVANELSKYRILQRDVNEKREAQRRELESIPSKIEKQNKRIALCEKDIAEINVIIAEEKQIIDSQNQAKAARRAALNDKNKIAAAVRGLEKDWKKAEKAAKKAEKTAETDKSEKDKAEALRKIAEEKLSLFEKQKQILASAWESVADARELVADYSEDNAVYRELKQTIYNATHSSININYPMEKQIAEYRGFKVVIPAYMKPEPVRERNSAGELIETDRTEPYVYLVRNGRYFVKIGEAFGILKRFDNIIDNLRGQKENLEKVLENFNVRQQVLSEELKNGGEGYLDEIERLREELDRLDTELGLKGVA